VAAEKRALLEDQACLLEEGSVPSEWSWLGTKPAAAPRGQVGRVQAENKRASGRQAEEGTLLTQAGDICCKVVSKPDLESLFPSCGCVQNTSRSPGLRGLTRLLPLLQLAGSARTGTAFCGVAVAAALLRSSCPPRADSL